MSVLDKVRKWIDGESAERVLEEAARNAQVSPRSRAEEFIVKIAKAVEEVMQRELVPLPQGTTIIPTEYMIFLSEQDDKDWQGVKRKGLEQGLYHILAERAKEIAGKRKLETQSFAVELRVDGTLEQGDVRVQHSWDDSSSNKTGVLARPKQMPKPTRRRLRAYPNRPSRCRKKIVLFCSRRILFKIKQFVPVSRCRPFSNLTYRRFLNIKPERWRN